MVSDSTSAVTALVTGWNICFEVGDFCQKLVRKLRTGEKKKKKKKDYPLHPPPKPIFGREVEKWGKTCFPSIYSTLVGDVPEPFLTIAKCYMSNKTHYVLQWSIDDSGSIYACWLFQKGAHKVWVLTKFSTKYVRKWEKCFYFVSGRLQFVCTGSFVYIGYNKLEQTPFQKS